MIYRISHPSKKIKTSIRLPASKSLSNRALIINSLVSVKGEINNLSDAGDTVLLQQLLASDEEVLDCRNAGTVLRFLTARTAFSGNEKVITGSDRMKQRPVKELVEALTALGARISFLETDGFPPFRISRGISKGGSVKISAGVSSQFISALMMIGPCLEKGLDLEMTGAVVSEPYIEMTRKVMQHYGIQIDYNDKHIRIRKQEYNAAPIAIEPDWSAASYWYEMAALAESAEIFSEGLHTDSLQGDAVISSLCKSFGVSTEPAAGGLFIRKSASEIPSYFNYNFSGCPDLAQTMACLCAGYGVLSDLAGLQTLRIKEANRAEALQRELYNLGVRTDFCDFSKLKIYNTRLPKVSSRPLKTHQDHRMAMALAPLALVLPYVEMEDPGVVEKSYPGFWTDLQAAGFEIAAS